jgi:hypothetical protein
MDLEKVDHVFDIVAKSRQTGEAVVGRSKRWMLAG